MKIAYFTFILISTLSLSSAQPPVLDTDRNPLVTNSSYYILPSNTGSGGGVNLTPTSRNPTCPLDVSRENNPQRNGSPVNFVLSTGSGVIRSSTDLNIRFSGATTCGKAAVWRLEDVNGQRVVSSRGSVGNPGQGTKSNWFKIEKYENDYKISYCPNMKMVEACGDIGDTIAKNGHISLLLSKVPLKVKFKKA